jgi:hypothetical protein
MITRHLLFPEHIGSYYLFSQSTAGVYIDHHSVRALIMNASGSSRSIVQHIEEMISLDTSVPLFERTTKALQHVLERIPQKCSIVSILPSNMVIYKTITVPLMSFAKIKQLVPFEIESSLPFSLTDAFIDSIIVGKHEVQKHAEVLVAATRKESLNEHLALFKACGKLPDYTTTDVIALCGLITELQPTLFKTYPFAVINIEYQATTILIFEKERIQHLRTLPYGSVHFHTKSPSDSPLTHALISTLTMHQENIAQEIVLCGAGVDQESLCSELHDALNISCIPLSMNRILHTHTITSKTAVDNQFLLPLASVLPSKMTNDFDINVESAHAADAALITRQIICALALFLCMMAALISVRIIIVRQLQSEIRFSEQETISLLTSELKLKLNPGASKSLDMVMNAARAHVTSQENIWFSLSSQRRALVLQALEDLSKIINRKELGLNLQKLSITESDGNMVMKMTGSVAEFKALDMIKESFDKSSRLSLKKKLPDTSFVAEIEISMEEAK